jgi:hypothetical protein
MGTIKVVVHENSISLKGIPRTASEHRSLMITFEDRSPGEDLLAGGLAATFVILAAAPGGRRIVTSVPHSYDDISDVRLEILR